ncbi:MAG: RecX family transcriptional regulator, partial [Phycisphaerae bacterium]|nr:RecX family transcriptional regulator [Phycisphaerae bacterium]
MVRTALTARKFITAIEPLAKDPSLVRVELDGTVVGTVLRTTADELGLRVGGRLTKSALATLAAAIDLAAARTTALKLVSKSDRSRALLASQLVERGHSESAAEAAVSRLAEDGWIDDARFASERARRITERRQLAHALLAMTLVNEGVPDRLAVTAAREHAPPETDIKRAITLAKRTLTDSATPAGGAKVPADAKLIRRAARVLARA